MLTAVWEMYTIFPWINEVWNLLMSKTFIELNFDDVLLQLTIRYVKSQLIMQSQSVSYNNQKSCKVPKTQPNFNWRL